MSHPIESEYVLCVSQGEYLASLELHKVYRRQPDADGEEHGLLRIVDESGEDYLFPASLFVAIDVPAEAREGFQTAR